MAMRPVAARYHKRFLETVKFVKKVPTKMNLSAVAFDRRIIDFICSHARETLIPESTLCGVSGGPSLPPGARYRVWRDRAVVSVG